MPRTCTICTHEQRAEIDQALVAGEALRDIARRCRVSKDAISRHKTHLPAHVAKAAKAQSVAQADSLLASVQRLRERLESALEKAEAARDVAALAREARETARLLLEVEGRLRQGAHVQVAVALVQSPEWAAVRTRTLRALEPFPEARRAVIAALTEVNPNGQPAGR